MTSFQPGQICTQDYVGDYGDGDHSDHHTVAYLTQAAQQQYAPSHTFTGYMDYPDTAFPINVSGADLTAKQNALYTYAQFDAYVCGSQSSCAGTNYQLWLERQYTVFQQTPLVANAYAVGFANLHRVKTWRLAAHGVHTGRSHLDVFAITDQPPKQPFRNRTAANIAGANKEDAFHDGASALADALRT